VLCPGIHLANLRGSFQCSSFPRLVNGMEIATPAAPAATISSLCVICSVAWYLALGIQVSISVVSAVPELVDVALRGVEDVVEEIVVGSKLVFRCLSIGVLFIAALIMVRVGYWLLAHLSEMMPSRHPHHEHGPSGSRQIG
jgi:hypothetical protein